MEDKLSELLGKIKALEREILDEVHTKEKEFYYKIHERKVQFDESVKAQHKQQAKRLIPYIFGVRPLVLLSAPFIYFCIFPALFLDLSVSIFQRICFPIYKIPRVDRSEYIIIDRHHLSYLNGIEKFNCIYCSYFTGLIAYAQEIAGRTEQFWCPIKHASKAGSAHGRYQHFIDYGDAERFKEELGAVRRTFDDLKK